MGLLDDAIREHLDLKRRRGADPAEVEQAEREALGPVRRGPADMEPGEPADNGLAAEPPVEPADDGTSAQNQPFDAEADPFEAEFESDPEASDLAGAEPSPAVRAPQPEPEPFAADPPPRSEAPTQARPAPRFDHEAEPEPDPESEHVHREVDDALREHTEPGRRIETPGDETAEYDVEGALDEPGEASEADAPKADEDVLEETPEFLQDTPDHDRLWFEQRPPRDFDFDG